MSLGVFLGESLVNVLRAFPMPLIGGMMFMVGVQLLRPVLRLRGWPLGLALLTGVGSVVTNMGAGFCMGLIGIQAVRWLIRRGVLQEGPE